MYTWSWSVRFSSHTDFFIQAIMWFGVWLSYIQYQMSSACTKVGISPHSIDVTPIRVALIVPCIGTLR